MNGNESVTQMLTVGIDMFMLQTKASMLNYIKFVKMGLENNTITMDRLNDAVARILSVKLCLGMVDIND